MQDRSYGRPVRLADDVMRVRAHNPSPSTGTGTNTYLVGRREIAVIDPGPALDPHLEAILAAIPPGARVTHILVTHAHLDHSGLAPRLAAQTGAPVLAFGNALAGRSQRMTQYRSLTGGEGLDLSFLPDVVLQDQERIESADWAIEALHTPGHLGGHLCFMLGEDTFSGDHAMGWSTSVVSPPDGDMTDYMASLARLREAAPKRLLPGHGDAVDDAPARLDALLHHRRDREAAILAALQAGVASPDAIARHVYTEIPADLLSAAARNVLAHLIDLTHRNLAVAFEANGTDVQFHAA